MTGTRTKRGLLWVVGALLALSAPTAGAATLKAVQSGTAVSSANGILTVPITSVDPTKASLIFQFGDPGMRIQ